MRTINRQPAAAAATTTNHVSEYGVPKRGEVGALLRLMNELHDLAEEPRLWKEHFLRTVGRLVGAPAGSVVLVHDVEEGKRWRYASVVDVGWAGEQRAAARRWLDGEGPSDPMEAAVARRQGELVTATRREVLSDQAWYESPHVREVRGRAGVDDCVYSLFRLPQPGWAMCVGFHRLRGERRRFGRRERVLVHLAHSGLGPLYQREARVADIVGGSRDGLTPRMRQTLDLLLTGLSEKEAARELRLSPNTVHVHVRSLYRHYNVNTRAELMAKLLPHPAAARALA